MKLGMDRLSHKVTIVDLEKGSSVTMTFDKEKALVADANKDGVVTFDCSKLIPKHLRKEIAIIVKTKKGNDIEHIYEVRQTKLIPKRIIEVRKEK